jgi:transposase
LSGGAGLLGQVEGRTARAVSQWNDAQTKTWRDWVQGRRPRLAAARDAGGGKYRGRRGRKGNREWELRNRLIRADARKQLDPMVEDLQGLPKKVGAPILTAWNCEEDLIDLLALTHTNPGRTVIAELLFRF